MYIRLASCSTEIYLSPSWLVSPMIKGVSLSLSSACLFIIALEMLALTASFHLIARPMGAGMSGMKRFLVLIFFFF